ncbi:MAG: hypothetical protein N2662_12200 [Bacteroidales bacterium]|nr:hypothetical protein [Bacteroidales bacterium]
MKVKNLTFLLLFFIPVPLSAQYTLMGQDPPTIEWRQIKTEKFQLIFDKAFEEQAQRTASILDYTLTLTGNTLNQPHRKIKILIHNHNAISNGFVTLAPARMEWYTAPPQDIYAQDWMEQLAIHEGRHWAQINRIQRRNVRFLRYLFGDVGWAIGIAQAHPWFLEGDAVVTETALSSTGRGRLPSFEMGFRTIQLTYHQPYPFRKSVFGAYDTYVPNRYELGYLMVAYNRIKYGPELWENVLEEIAYNPFIAPFNISLKKQTGLNREKLYRQTFQELDSMWTASAQELKYTPYSVIQPLSSESYTAYRSPQTIRGKIVALKTGLDYAPQIVLIDPTKGREQILVRTGILPSERITTANDIIYYDEYQPDARWGNRVYSVVKSYNLQTQENKILTQKTRYFAPAPSPSGNSIVVVENDIYGQNYLTLINPKDGRTISRISSPANAALQFPSWSADEKKIVCTLVDTSGKNLVWLDLSDKSWKILLNSKKHDFSNPIFAQHYILFRATYSGIDNIFAFDTTTSKVYQLTSAQFGAFDPCFDSSSYKLLYCNYDIRGYELVNAKFDELAFISLDQVKDISLNLAEKIQDHEPVKFDRNNINYSTFNSRPYRKWQNAINIHSWIPFYTYTPKNTLQSPKIFPGYNIMSQNLLGTLTINAGQGYYNRNLYNQLEINYYGIFPVFQIGIQQGDTIRQINVQNLNYKEKELKIYSGISIPLNYSTGQGLFSVIPSATYEYENTYYRTSESTIKRGINKLYLSGKFVGYRRMAPKDFIPQLGMVFDFVLTQPVTGQNDFATQITTRSSIYLPGFSNHHAFNFIIAYENQSKKTYLYNTRLDPPRGYIATWDSIKPYLKGTQQFSADYYLPLSYSSYSLFKIIYVKLLAGSVFGSTAITDEYQPQRQNYKQQFYSSVGYQIFTDFNLFFFPITFRFGYNYSLQIGKNKAVVEPYLRVNYSF